MPSWNIHIAHVERLLERHRPQDLGIADTNVFLFGNFVPDIYVGYMVPDTTVRIDYLITHVAAPSIIPVPDADRFWDDYLFLRKPSSPEGVSLVLGAWAHLVADRFYNGNFRSFWETHEVPDGDELRKRKQADFDLFGHSLRITSHVRVTAGLEDAALAFLPYSILPADVRRSVDVAGDIVRANGSGAKDRRYQLLGADWMSHVFDACDRRIASWLAAWQRLEGRGEPASAAALRAELGLPQAVPEDPKWVRPSHPGAARR